MSRPPWVRPVIVAFAVVMAILSAALGVWWTFAGMVLLAIVQLLSIRHERRTYGG